MTSIKETIKKLFPQIEPLSTGSYHYASPPDAEFPYRMHLRVEPDGNGLMIVNASTVLHLNQTAAEYAYHYIMDHDDDETAKTIASRYPITRKQAEMDYAAFKEHIQHSINRWAIQNKRVKAWLRSVVISFKNPCQ